MNALRTRRRWAAPAALALAALVLTLGAAAAAARTPDLINGSAARPPLTCGAFTVEASPNGGGSNTLLGVAALSPSDVWAVGSAGSATHTLTEHWTGSGWNVVGSTDPGSAANALLSVAAVNSGDAWAVGYYSNSGGAAHTLAEHWTGATWTPTSTHNVGSGANELLGVAAVSPTDVWAVGFAVSGTVRQTLIEHWDGATWTVVASPSPGSSRNELEAVAAVNSGDVWAVGFYKGSGNRQTLTEHWNGAAWSVAPSDNNGTLDNELSAVTALSSGDVWAAGNYYTGAYDQTLIEHWNGGPAWALFASPDSGAVGNDLYGVAAVGPSDVWAVGAAAGPAGSPALTEHWDGSSWTLLPGPAPGSVSNGLYAAAALPTGDVWAVGATASSGTTQTLVEHLAPCLATATPTITLTPTLTPTATPTRTHAPTQTPGGPTATPEPTNCPIQFSDVDPTNPFFTFVRCLACRQIVSGYADGTYRPNNVVTRGQMAKFISNAAGYTDAIPPSQQTFSDVPTSQPFWLFVERAYLHGVISGYADGTFRPNNGVTRGQTSKFIANAFYPGCETPRR